MIHSTWQHHKEGPAPQLQIMYSLVDREEPNMTYWKLLLENFNVIVYMQFCVFFGHLFWGNNYLSYHLSW